MILFQVMDGPFNGREGEVKHLYRGTAFIYNRKVLTLKKAIINRFYSTWKMAEFSSPKPVTYP